MIYFFYKYDQGKAMAVKDILGTVVKEVRDLLFKPNLDPVLEQFKPSAIAHRAKPYTSSSNVQISVKADDDAKVLLDALPTQFNQFAKAGQPLTAQFQASNQDSDELKTAKANFNNAFNNELKSHSAMDKVLDEYKENVKTLIKSYPDGDPQAIASALMEYKAEAAKNLETAITERTTAFTALLNDNTMRSNIATCLGLSYDPNPSPSTEALDKFRDEIIKEQEALDKAAIKKFEKAAQNNIDTILDKISADQHRLSYLAYSKKNTTKHKPLKRLTNQNSMDEELQRLQGTQSEEERFKGIKIEDISDAKLQTIDGTIIAHDKIIGSFSLQLPNRIIPSFLAAKAEHELFSLAELVKETGAKSIIMNITDKDPEIAMKNARLAYKACVQAGFPLDKITIKVNGDQKTGKYDPKTKTTSENLLFKDDSETLAGIQQLATKIKEEQDKLAKDQQKIMKSTVNQMKNEVKKTREDEADLRQNPQAVGP